MNKDFQTLRKSLVSGALLLSMMLTGCTGDKDDSKKVYVGNNDNDSVITYVGENQELMSGTILADNVDKYIKIVTYKSNDHTFTKLTAINDYVSIGGRGEPSERVIKYADIESSTTLISYSSYNFSGADSVKTYEVGENLEIIEVRDFMPYLYQEGKFADEYDINDLVSFYHEKVEPILEKTDEIILG